MSEPRRFMGGWYPTDHGPSPADLYAAWLDANGYEDTPEQQAEFAGDAAGLEELLGED